MHRLNSEPSGMSSDNGGGSAAESGGTFKIARAPLSARGESALGSLSARGATSALGPSTAVAAAPALPPLPPGWQQLQDPSGKAYYFNPETETTQWARPAPVAEVGAAAISIVVADEAPTEVASAPPASPSAGTLKAASAFKRLVGAKGASSGAQPAAATASAAASAAEESAPAASPASVTMSPDSLAGKAALAFRGKHFRQGSSAMKEYAFPDNKEAYAPLPKGFTGAENLQLPNYLRTRNSGVTLPSRLEVLGNNEYKIASTLSAASIGNAVVGFHYDAETWCNRFCCTSETIKQFCSCCLRPPSTRPVKQLFLLPHIFSKAMARMSLFVLAMVAFIALIQILNLSQAFDINVGRAWMIGAGLSFIVMFILSQRKFQPDGVMAFCRSMGVPEVEELMFSYSWKIQEDAIRTLAKAVWSTGVGVWIDVAKLCPGDEIRPVVRSMVRSVYKCVVFISTEYIKSPNCCVEFWEAAQYPEKLIICVLDKLPDDVQAYLDKLVLPEQMVHSLEEVIPLLNQHINDDKDMAAYEWWKNQAIAGGGVPSHVAPNDAGDNAWTLPMFQLWGRVFIPTRSLSVGPAYLSGDCVEHGLQSRWPWLLIITFIGLAINGIDIYLKVFQADIKRTGLDYAWLILLFICDLAPLVAWSRLFDTRVLCDAALRPLMASRSLKGGVQIRINGKDDDPVVKCLRDFLRMLGHLAEPKSERRITVSGQEDEVDRVITVEVMNSKEHRDALFSDDEFPFDIRKTLFIWSGASDPFGKNDPAGSRMMRFLVLVKEWEKENLAESLFSAIGMRVVDVLHAKGD